MPYEKTNLFSYLHLCIYKKEGIGSFSFLDLFQILFIISVSRSPDYTVILGSLQLKRYKKTTYIKERKKTEIKFK